MTSSEASEASEAPEDQTHPFFPLPSQEGAGSIGSLAQAVRWAGIPLVVSLLPLVPSILFLFLFLFPSSLLFYSSFICSLIAM